uniref:Right handed beta helix domain-containing protein n=1 Tax=Streptomyces sp. NBC_00049 TaxID=2903617 RepID=A0AAU2JPA5_9ACTN
MRTRTSLIRGARALCVSTVAVLASTLPAAPASAATLVVACNETALRNAVTTANGTPASDTLDLAPGCTYGLTSELPAFTGPTIVNGAATVITRTSGTFRIPTVNGGNLALRSTTITNGDASGSALVPGTGGGIVVTGNGVLTVTSSVIRGNRAGVGGGLRVFGGSRGQVTASVVTANSAAQNGGGVFSDGDVTVNSSRVAGNTALGAGGGIANGLPSVAAGTAALNASSVTGNTATAGPGGIYDNGTAVTLRATRVVTNVPGNCAGSPNPVPGCVG